MSRKVTAHDVALAANVSAATVDRVLNNRGGVAQDKERAVMAAARRLGLDRALQLREARTLRIAILTQPRDNPFHALVQRSFQDANREFASLNLQFRLHHADPARPAQTAARIRALAQDHEAIVTLSPDDPDITQALRAFADAGKPVIALATDIRGLSAHRYIGPDNHQSGRVAGHLMGRLMGKEGGDILIIAGLLSMTGQKERVAGFRAALQDRFPLCRIEAVLESHERGEDAGDLAYGALRKNPALRGIYNASAGAPAVVRARHALGRSAQTVFITHELTDSSRALLKSGEIDAIIDQDPAHEVRVVVETLAMHFGRAATAPESGITPVHIHMMENC